MKNYLFAAANRGPEAAFEARWGLTVQFTVKFSI
jgi:hypothetical protein